VPERQLDLVTGTGIGAEPSVASGIRRRHVSASEPDDDALIAAIPTL
jgi:hypothetical protein